MASGTRPRPPFERIALLLQGGGALGAYQAGVYEALAEADLHPDWIAGISIGAINGALIAGNAPEARVDKLRVFWERVTAKPCCDWSERLFLATSDAVRQWQNQMSANLALVSGASGFFTPRVPPPWLHPAGTVDATSIYDTSGLKSTLERLIDFDRLNAGAMRFSIGAVHVRSGNLVYFDNATHAIGPEHIMASGALPPGFPAIEIEGELYWDGGLVSNTPLQWVGDRHRRRDTLAFQVDLWSASGELPRTIAEVSTRQKEIQYSSRTRAGTDSFKYAQRLRRAMADLLEKLPEPLQTGPEAQLLRTAADHKVYNIVHLIYRAKNYEGHSKDTSSRAPACRSTGVLAITMPFAPCAIRKCLSAPPITKASSPSTSLMTAVSKNETCSMLSAFPLHRPLTNLTLHAPKEIAMNTLRLQCPAASREVDSGISTHRSTRLISIRARCPICEDVHEWQVADGTLGTVLSAANHSNGARLTNARSELQDFQGASTEIIELREQLLDELNHRLKNNLQILYGLLQTACRKTNNSEAREVLADTSRRIGAMGAAQQIFYSARHSTDVSGQRFLEAVCANARVFFGKEVSINYEATTGSLPKETAVPLALVLNELLTNAAKHGANDRGRVTINVGLSQRSGSHELYVQDRGPGFSFEEAQGRSSGLGQVTKLAQRLKGTFTVERKSGARCTVRFPD